VADPKTPRVRILMRIKDVLDNADLAGLSGTANVTVRHTRHRWANVEERPCISLRMVSDEPDDDYHGMQERRNMLAVDMQIDADLQTEDSELDPTGLERLSAIANAALQVLKAKEPRAEDPAGATIYDVCDEIVDLGVQSDDDNEADEGRFIHRIIVLYRTAIEDPNLLLAEGENL